MDLGAASQLCRQWLLTWGATGCALVAAAAAGYLFIWSTMPIPFQDEPPLWRPRWLFTIMYFLALLSLALGGVLLLVVVGRVLYLHHLPVRRRRIAAWVGAGSAGITIEVLYVAGLGLPSIVPTYAGPAVVGLGATLRGSRIPGDGRGNDRHRGRRRNGRPRP